MRYRIVLKRRNPSHPVMSYAAAHAWERQAAERGVSEVARSARGFMRAYQRAGTFSRLDPWWQRRRDGFIARHMAQANRGERLWEKVRGSWRPTRRALALIMWAYMPPGRPAGVRQNPVRKEIIHVTDTKPAERRYAALADDDLFTDKAMKLLDEIDAVKAKARAEILRHAPFQALQITLDFPNDKMAPYFVVIHRYTKFHKHDKADQDRLSRSTIWQASYFDNRGAWRDSKHPNVGQLIKEAQDDFYADTSKVIVIR